MSKDDEPKPYNPKDKAELDQSVAMISDYSASMSGRFFNNLINDQGMSRPEALALTVAFISNNFCTNHGGK